MEKTLHTLQVSTIISRKPKNFKVTLLAKNNAEVEHKLQEWFRFIRHSSWDHIVSWKTKERQ